MRFSSSLVAFIYLGFAAAAALPTVPIPSSISRPTQPTLPTQTPGLSARMLPNVGGASAPPPISTSLTGVTGALPVKVPRGDSDVLGDVLDAAGKGGKGGKNGAIAMARQIPTTGLPLFISTAGVPIPSHLP